MTSPECGAVVGRSGVHAGQAGSHMSLPLAAYLGLPTPRVSVVTEDTVTAGGAGLPSPHWLVWCTYGLEQRLSSSGQGAQLVRASS